MTKLLQHKIKKPGWMTGLFFHLESPHKSDYLRSDLEILFSKRVARKLTTAPTTASTAVLAISSDKMFGIILSKVPDAVPTLRDK